MSIDVYLRLFKRFFCSLIHILCLFPIIDASHTLVFANISKTSLSYYRQNQHWQKGDNSFNAKTLYSRDTLEISLRCLRIIHYFEVKYRLPRHLLHAISLVESGRFNSITKTMMPWPWTLNVGGKPYILHSKIEALNVVKRFLNSNKRVIDIGCAQVNYRYHHHHFQNLEQMMNPVQNIAYAAHFLREKYNNVHHWPSAVSAYHSKDKSLGFVYMAKVMRIFKKLQHDNYDTNIIAYTGNLMDYRKRINNMRNESTRSKAGSRKHIQNNDILNEDIMVHFPGTYKARIFRK